MKKKVIAESILSSIIEAYFLHSCSTVLRLSFTRVSMRQNIKSVQVNEEETVEGLGGWGGSKSIT